MSHEDTTAGVSHWQLWRAGQPVGCTHLTVHLPHPGQAVVQVVAALWPDVDIVSVKSSPAQQEKHVDELQHRPELPLLFKILSAPMCCHNQECWEATEAVRSPEATVCGPPEEAPEPGHLAQGQVVLGWHEEVCDSQQANLGVQV